ncbi:hypothetical protein ACJX0J_030723, partial [Zea mays]
DLDVRVIFLMFQIYLCKINKWLVEQRFFLPDHGQNFQLDAPTGLAVKIWPNSFNILANFEAQSNISCVITLIAQIDAATVIFLTTCILQEAHILTYHIQVKK